MCPVLICAGWRDGYRTAALRMAHELEAPWQLIAGPWCHKLPDRGIPGPRYPFLAEMARFFHHHLDDAPGDDGVERPRSVFFIGSPDTPVRPHSAVSGEWLGSERWPAGVERTTLTLGSPGGGPRQRDHRDHDRAVVPTAAGDRPVPRSAPRRRAQRHLRQRAAGRAGDGARRAGRALRPAPSRPPHARLGQAPERRAGRLLAADHHRGRESRGGRRGLARAAADDHRVQLPGGLPDPGLGGGERLAQPVAAAGDRTARDHLAGRAGTAGAAGGRRAVRAAPSTTWWRSPSRAPTPRAGRSGGS